MTDRPRKETSPEISRLAGVLSYYLRGALSGEEMVIPMPRHVLEDLRRVCMSAISQDETPKKDMPILGSTTAQTVMGTKPKP